MNEQRIVNLHKTTKQTEATYVMTAAFRIQNNHALSYLLSTYQNHTIVVYRRLEENPRNNDFFDSYLPSLIQELETLTRRVIYTTDTSFINELSGDIILDNGYLLEEKMLEQALVEKARLSNVNCIALESNVVVPVLIASQKEEYGARTIRPKIMNRLDQFYDPVLMDFPRSKAEQEAHETLITFIEEKLPHYDLKNNPELEYTSDLSAYLKYGYISPLSILVELSTLEDENKVSFIEELVVRRELSYNFIYYNENYNDFHHITYDWAYQTMEQHLTDPREYIYSLQDYVNFKTHDPYFNAAMKEMVYKGKMHGYMRMYWCKKIIEWSKTYEEAYHIAITLNNYYFLDGNTPNGYTGVAWCYGKHDRAWTERPIFGKLRYMNANGLKRKFDIDEYVRKMSLLQQKDEK